MSDFDDTTYLALCIYDEARGEIDDGKAAVARVVMNRAHHQYASDGTIKGTVLRKDQFSGFWFDMVNGHYTRVCHTMEDAEARAKQKYAAAQQHFDIWASCKNIAAVMLHGHYQGGVEFNKMTDETMLYANLAISNPNWAIPSKRVCQIGHHTFFAR